MSRIRQLWIYSPFAAAMLFAGCALPDYHLPAGFSSTYYRHLQGTFPTTVNHSLVAPVPATPAEALPRSYMPPPPAPAVSP